MTGIRCDGGKSIATASYDAADGSFALHKQERVGRDYPGTGDIFASVLLGRLLCGSPLADAAASASSFAARCAAATLARGSGEPARNGVALEPLLGSLSGGIPADKNL